MDPLHREVDPLLQGASKQTRWCMKPGVLKAAMAVAVAVLAVAGLAQATIGVVMATNWISCSTTPHTIANSTPLPVVRHSLALPGAMAVPSGLFNLSLSAVAILLICCCRGCAKELSQLWCYITIIAVLILYLVYTVSTLIALLLQNCHELIAGLFLAIMIANLLLGTVAISMGPYLIFCLLVSKKHAITTI